MIVSDTSPIVSLAMIGRASLLGSLYQEVVIPGSVRDEVEAGVGQAGAAELARWEWVRVMPVSNVDVRRVLRISLEAGEAETIALSMELKPALVLLDERKGRLIALKLGLPVAGTLDVLCAAKQSGLISAVRPVLDELIVRAHFRVSKGLYRKLLGSMGEDEQMRMRS